jgi:cysteinyl-tRNA synthetase
MLGKRVDVRIRTSSHHPAPSSYVSQDFIRRILRDYFGYDLHVVMNITDIDDKVGFFATRSVRHAHCLAQIILRARQKYLVAQLVARHAQLSHELVDHVQSAWTAYFEEKLLPILGEQLAWPDVVQRVTATGSEGDAARLRWRQKDEKFEMHYDALASSARALDLARASLASGAVASDSVTSLIAESDGIVALAEDKVHAATVTDHSIFRQLAQHFEASFFRDMDQLNVERPAALTRVSEYVDEIVAFIQGIIDNGYAYADGGDVYFDTKVFDGAQAKGKGREDDAFMHTYAKLKPEAKGHQSLLDEGEGELASLPVLDSC